jgi:tetratricopeptide (TPR) repeat protein
MYKVLFLPLLVFIMFSGCSTHSLSEEVLKQQEHMYVYENTLILFALDAENRNNSAEAVGYFDLLYEKTQDTIYQENAMNALMKGRYYNDVVSRLSDRRQNGEVLSEQSLRYLIVSLLSKKDLVAAKQEALGLVEKSPTEQNYLILAEVYLAEDDYINALATLEEAYQLNYSEQALDKMAVIIYTNMHSPYQAIARIEEHSKNFGYSLLLTKRLVAFYGDQRDEEGLLNSYPHLYALEPTDYNAGILIQLYWNAKKVQELTRFLEQSNANDELLLKIYSSEKVYSKAIPLSQKLYEETGEIDYLGQKAIYQYEAADKRDKKLVDSVISDLVKVVQVKEISYYLNYLGYCMIEYDRDVEAGIGYVKRALAIEPDSGYFIDSLAWGYYKQGECVKAGELMKRVVELLGSDDAEVKAHLNAINKCIKRKNVK